MKRLLLCLFVAACGKSDSTPADDKAAAAPPAKLPDNAVTAANDAVRTGMRDKLTFVAGTIADDDLKILVVQPQGWEESKAVPGLFKAPDGLGFMTKLSVGSSCDGACEKKDWVAATNREVFDQFAAGFTIEKDEKADGMRTLVADKDGKKYIAVAKWKADATRYASCTATLDTEAVEAVHAFEQACRAMTPQW